jgi:hypothetical protein
MGTGVFLPRVKRPGREADHSSTSTAEVKRAWSYSSTPHTSSWRRTWLRTRNLPLPYVRKLENSMGCAQAQEEDSDRLLENNVNVSRVIV